MKKIFVLSIKDTSDDEIVEIAVEASTGLEALITFLRNYPSEMYDPREIEISEPYTMLERNIK